MSGIEGRYITAVPVAATSAPASSFEFRLEVDATLDPSLRDVVLYALAGADSDAAQISAADGFSAIRKHLSSVGRFGSGHGALLLPLYGIGELPQAFCRAAAVAGARCGLCSVA